MCRVKFDGSGFIGFRDFALFGEYFFSTDRTFLTKIYFLKFYIVVGVGIIFFLWQLSVLKTPFPIEI